MACLPVQGSGCGVVCEAAPPGRRAAVCVRVVDLYAGVAERHACPSLGSSRTPGCPAEIEAAIGSTFIHTALSFGHHLPLLLDDDFSSPSVLSTPFTTIVPHNRLKKFIMQIPISVIASAQ